MPYKLHVKPTLNAENALQAVLKSVGDNLYQDGLLQSLLGSQVVLWLDLRSDPHPSTTLNEPKTVAHVTISLELYFGQR